MIRFIIVSTLWYLDLVGVGDWLFVCGVLFIVLSILFFEFLVESYLLFDVVIVFFFIFFKFWLEFINFERGGESDDVLFLLRCSSISFCMCCFNVSLGVSVIGGLDFVFIEVFEFLFVFFFLFSILGKFFFKIRLMWFFRNIIFFLERFMLLLVLLLIFLFFLLFFRVLCFFLYIFNIRVFLLLFSIFVMEFFNVRLIIVLNEVILDIVLLVDDLVLVWIFFVFGGDEFSWLELFFGVFDFSFFRVLFVIISLLFFILFCIVFSRFWLIRNFCLLFSSLDDWFFFLFMFGDFR